MRFICITLMLFFNIPISLAFTDVLEISGILPNISPALIFLFSFIEKDKLKGFLIGLIGGFFQGIVLGESFLIYSFLFGGIGFLSGHAGELLKRKRLIASTLLIFIFSLVFGIGCLIFKNISGWESSIKGYILFKVLPKSLYTGFISLPLYFLIEKIPKDFCHIKRKREAFYKK